MIDLREKLLARGWQMFPGHEKWTEEDLRATAAGTSQLSVTSNKGRVKKVNSVLNYTGNSCYRITNTLDGGAPTKYKSIADIPLSVDRYWFCAASKACFEANSLGSKGKWCQSISGGTSNAANHAEQHGVVNKKTLAARKVR